MVYDRTCRTHPWGTRRLPIGLSHAWSLGGPLYTALGYLDAYYGATSWAQALQWLAEVHAPAPIQEIQFWGHGRWGQAFIAYEALQVDALAEGHPLYEPLRKVAARLTHTPRATWWFRTCETFATEAGHNFAVKFAQTLGCRVAGHTHVIGAVQSGLCVLEPGDAPAWPAEQGIKRDASGQPFSEPSRMRAPNTITFLRGKLPPSKR